MSQPISTLVLKQIHLVTAMLSKLDGAQFKIILPDGQSFGELAVAPAPTARKARQPRHPHGSLRALYLPHIQSLTLGDVAVIPVPPDIPLEHVRSSLCAYASTTWGLDTYTSTLNHSSHSIELLRTA